jgi:excisionase family DNA binding protein
VFNETNARSCNNARMDTPTEITGYLSKDDARSYTGLSTRLLDLAVARRQLRAFKVGKRVLFLRADIDAFVQQHAIGAIGCDLEERA